MTPIDYLIDISELSLSNILNMQAILTLFLILYFSSSNLFAGNPVDQMSEIALQVSELVFKNPEDFKNQTYCYFVFQGVLNSEQIPPKLYASFVKGSSLSNEGIAPYKSWLDTKDGKKCKVNVGKKFKLFKADHKKAYTIFLNQHAIIIDQESLEKTLNHERLHVVFALRKADRQKIIAKWKSLSLEEQAAFKEKHTGYDYSNEDITLREFFSYTYENTPSAGIELLSK